MRRRHRSRRFRYVTARLSAFSRVASRRARRTLVTAARAASRAGSHRSRVAFVAAIVSTETRGQPVRQREAAHVLQADARHLRQTRVFADYLLDQRDARLATGEHALHGPRRRARGARVFVSVRLLFLFLSPFLLELLLLLLPLLGVNASFAT